ncbi:MAG: hypothetical protein IPN33_21875 [Saprospiraceae bacterium]|nr:hypothetical protein [Saprospiraceae bacterium]
MSNREKVYLLMVEDTIQVYAVEAGRKIADTTRYRPHVFPEVSYDIAPSSFQVIKSGLDFDFITIAFKYRPSRRDIPPQLHTNLNGAIYLGYRTDWYRIRYDKTPLGVYRRHFRNTGFDFGGFAGIGSTAINYTVTGGRLDQDYEGIICSTGLGAFTGLDSFGFGLTIGWDFLLDNNSQYWLYHRAPWIGLALGINLN